jgi:hypothetical protein
VSDHLLERRNDVLEDLHSDPIVARACSANPVGSVCAWVSSAGRYLLLSLRLGYACIGQVVESDQTVFAFHPHQDVFAARAGELIPLPAIDHASATLLPLVETALQVTLDAGTGYRERVIVLGAGVLGLLTALLLQRSGCRTLLAEPQPWRRHMATSLGATAAAPEELAQQKVDRLPAARRGRYHGHAG